MSSEVAMLYFWVAVLLWDHAPDTATHPAPNAAWLIERFIAVCFYFQAITAAIHNLAAYLRS